MHHLWHLFFGLPCLYGIGSGISCGDDPNNWYYQHINPLDDVSMGSMHKKVSKEKDAGFLHTKMSAENVIPFLHVMSDHNVLASKT